MLPGSVSAEPNQSTAGLEEGDRVLDMFDIRSVAEGWIHDNAVKLPEVAVAFEKVSADNLERRAIELAAVFDRLPSDSQ